MRLLDLSFLASWDAPLKTIPVMEGVETGEAVAVPVGEAIASEDYPRYGGG